MKKTTLLFLLISGSVLSFSQTILNNSFEDWSSRYGKTAPTGWIVDSISIVKNIVKKVTPGSVGTSAIQLGTATYDGETVGSFITREDSFLKVIPTELTFDYKVMNNITSDFNGLQIDITFLDSKKKDITPNDAKWSSAGNNTNFASGKMAIKFAAGDIPKYYTLLISYFNIKGLNNELAIIDNLKFGTTGSVSKTNVNTPIKVYPNPASNTIHFTDAAKDKLSKARLISIDGKVSDFQVNNSSIDISNLSKGIYMVELFDTENNFIKREKISVVN